MPDGERDRKIRSPAFVNGLGCAHPSTSLTKIAPTPGHPRVDGRRRRSLGKAVAGGRKQRDCKVPQASERVGRAAWQHGPLVLQIRSVFDPLAGHSHARVPTPPGHRNCIAPAPSKAIRRPARLCRGLPLIKIRSARARPPDGL